MRRLAPLAAALVLASGCMLVFDEGGEGGEGGDSSDGGGDDVCEPGPIPSVRLRSPETLECAEFFGCEGRCGPCPFAFSLPPPPWGFCGDPCEALDETACAASATCRVAKDARCAVSGDCELDFLGCFPTNQFAQPGRECFAARTGEECADGMGCTAYHRRGELPGSSNEFAMCAPAGVSPGTCFGEVTCASAAPSCPAGSRPGVAGGCYTGGCIPQEVCELGPQP